VYALVTTTIFDGKRKLGTPDGTGRMPDGSEISAGSSGVVQGTTSASHSMNETGDEKVF
jgi:hypothetical protein